MARIRWHGTEFSATPVRELPNGEWIMTPNQHGPRFSKGIEIRVKQREIIEMAAAEMPDDDGLAALDAAMAEERKTLPSPAKLLALARAKVEQENDEPQPALPDR